MKKRTDSFRKSTPLFVGALLVLFILLNLFLMTFRPEFPELWGDEVFFIMTGSQDITTIYEAQAHDRHPPLYPIMIHGWISMFGSGIFSLRMLSALFVLLSIPILFLLARKLFSLRVALIAVMFFSISAFVVSWGRMLRSHSLTLFLGLALTLLFFWCVQYLTAETKSARDDNKRRNQPYHRIKKYSILTLYAVLALSLAYTNYLVFLMVLGSHHALIIWKYRKLIRPFLLIDGVTTLLFLPFLMRYISLILTKNAPVTYSDISLNLLVLSLGGLAIFLHQFIFGMAVYPWSIISIIGSIIIIAYLFWEGHALFVKHRKSLSSPAKDILFLGISQIVICFFVLFILGNGAFLFYPNKYYIVAPLLILFFAVLVSKSKRSIQIPLIVILVGIQLFSLMSFYSYNGENRGFAEWAFLIPYREIGHTIQNESDENPLIIYDITGFAAFTAHYVWGEKIPSFTADDTPGHPFYATISRAAEENNIYTGEDARDVNLTRFADIWIISSDRMDSDYNREVMLDNSENYQLVSRTEYITESPYNQKWIERIYGRMLTNSAISLTHYKPISN